MLTLINPLRNKLIKNKVLLTSCCLFFLFLPVRADSVVFNQKTDDLLPIMNFDQGFGQNLLEGYCSKYETMPSSANIYFSKKVFRGEEGRSMRITGKKRPGSFCGIWMHLFNDGIKNPEYVDATKYEYLSFWVKGKKGGEEFSVKLADDVWVALYDSVIVGNIKDFLPQGVTQEWQEVLVPMDNVRKINLLALACLVFDFVNDNKDETVFIDDIVLKKNKEVINPITPKANTSVASANEKRAVPPKSMWIWFTEELLLDKKKSKELFDFSIEHDIKHLWLQIVSNLNKNGVEYDIYGPPQKDTPDIKVELLYIEELKWFIREANAHGLKVHALDGYPEYTQKEYHYLPLGLVDAVIKYNKEVAPEERYYGIHFDNEPYLIVAWRDWEIREQMLKEFLDLNVECQRRVNEHSDMVFGVDIPVFWNQKEWNWYTPKGNRINGLVTYNGKRQPADFHCIDLLDNVGLMNYRDHAHGSDSMIQYGKPILEYADKAKHAKIYMGVETFTYQPIKVWFPVGLPHSFFSKVIRDGGAVEAFSHLSRVHGFRTQVFDDSKNFHLGIELPPNPTPADEERMLNAVLEIRKHLGASAYPELADQIEDLYLDGIFGISADFEWENAYQRDIVDPKTGKNYTGFIATSLMIPKITFADETYEEFVEQMEAAEEEFSKYSSFEGMAIHFYKTIKEKADDAAKEK